MALKKWNNWGYKPYKWSSYWGTLKVAQLASAPYQKPIFPQHVKHPMAEKDQNITVFR